MLCRNMRAPEAGRGQESEGEVFEHDGLEQPFTQDEHGTGEDALFQIRAKTLGYRSYIDPTLIVGHEKMMILT